MPCPLRKILLTPLNAQYIGVNLATVVITGGRISSGTHMPPREARITVNIAPTGMAWLAVLKTFPIR
ncbi:hypothetical protein D3C72_2248700 [compost metagenome]